MRTTSRSPRSTPSPAPQELAGYRSTEGDRARIRERWRPYSKNFAGTMDYYSNPANRGARGQALEPEERFMIGFYQMGYASLGPEATDKQGYGAMNRALRSGDPRRLEPVEAEVKVLASALAKLPPWKGRSYRRARLDPKDLEPYQPGAIVTELTFLSTTPVRYRPDGPGTVEWSIEGHGSGRDITDLGLYEAEILYPPGTQFEVTARRTSATGGHEEVEMVDRGPVRRSTPASRPGPSAEGERAARAALAAWRAPRFDAASFAEAVARLPALRERWHRPVGVAEGLTLAQHTRMVLAQFTKYFGRPAYPLAVALCLHDAGKPDAAARGMVRDPRELTRPIFFDAFAQLGLQRSEAERWWPLVEGDPIGLYLRRYQSLDAAAKSIAEGAKRSGLDLQTFFGHLTRYYQADAGSYTVDAGLPSPSLDELFARDPRAAFVVQSSPVRLRFNPPVERAFGELERRVKQIAGA